MKNKYTATILRAFNKYASDHDISIPGTIGGGVAGGALGGIGHFGYEVNNLNKLLNKVRNGDVQAALEVPFKYPETAKSALSDFIRGSNLSKKNVAKGITKDIFKLMKRNPKLLATTIGIPTVLGAYLGS